MNEAENAETAAPPLPPTRPRLALRVAKWLDARGTGPIVLAVVALVLAGIGAFGAVVRHPGLGGILGLLAVGVGGLATVGSPDERRAGAPLARGLAAAVDWILLGAVLASAAAADLLVRVLLGLGVAGLHAWLPQLKTAAPVEARQPHAGLWRRADRLTIVLVGAILGPVDLALILVIVVGALDATLRLGHLRGDPDAARGPAFLRPLTTEDGELEPVVRWGSVLLALLLLAVLSRLLAPEGGWPF